MESVAEIILLIYNIQKRRKNMKISDNTANDVLFVAYNGPKIGEADAVLRKTMNLHSSQTRGDGTVYHTC